MSEALDRAAIIEAMCLTWRHDFGLDRINDALVVGCGMSEGERDFLRKEMGQLVDHHFAPALAAALERERQTCLEIVKSHGSTHPKIQYVVAELEKRCADLGQHVSMSPAV
ncbi:hypothetical protein PQR64_23140 [Paraburkholderia phytofirmans]|uniref:hypothetical protein n=1 Tax=Paraburkholderia phytofirmans TaxID=261302 RepID=UPI0038B97E37